MKLNLFQQSKKNTIKWVSDNHIIINGVGFCTIKDIGDLLTFKSSPNQMLLGKINSMVQIYIEIHRQMRIHRIFEIGILKGGSCAFFHSLFKPDKLVAIDIKKKPAEDLSTYIKQKKCQHSLIPHYGVNQSDDQQLTEILEKEFPDRNIDLIVDDASHQLHETRVSFNRLFPFLRAGGLFVIEDWGWSHMMPEEWLKKPESPWYKKPALTYLLFEVVMACASIPDLIDDIKITPHLVIIRRGSKSIPDDFDISQNYQTRGLSITPL